MNSTIQSQIIDGVIEEGDNDTSDSTTTHTALGSGNISQISFNRPLHVNSKNKPNNQAQQRKTFNSSHQPLKLTLSAFRKPESAVRLTAAHPTKVLLDDYDLNSISKVLGHGASSTVRLAKHRISGRKVAVKCIGKHQILRNYLHGGKKKSKSKLDECEVLSMLRNRHENIINLIDVYETDNQVQMVMEYCAGGELFDAIKRRRPIRRGSGLGAIGATSTEASAAAPVSTNYASFDERFISHSSYKDDDLDVDTSQSSSCSTQTLSRPSPQHKNISGPSTTRNPNPTDTCYTEPQAARIATQLLSALTFLHSKGIVHRDVKPENILLVSDDEDDLNVKLSDFGLARILRQVEDDSFACGGNVSPMTPPSARRSRAYSRVGSDYYVAPEMTLRSGYDTAVDMYSLGVTLYILLSGIPPASRQRCGSTVLDYDDDDNSSYYSSEDDSDEPTSASHKEDHYRFSSVDFPRKQWKNISHGAKDLIRRMLHSDPNLRIKAEDALQHEWILLNKHSLQIKHHKKRAFYKPMDHASLVQSMMSSKNLKSNQPSLQWSFLGSKNLETKPRRRKQSREELQGEELPKKRRKTTSKRRALDIRIPPPQNVSLSMVELYSRMSSAAAAVASDVNNVNNYNDSSEVVVDMDVDDERSSDNEQASCFTNSGAVALSV
jgi:serine/threonine protein kinase